MKIALMALRPATSPAMRRSATPAHCPPSGAVAPHGAASAVVAGLCQVLKCHLLAQRIRQGIGHSVEQPLAAFVGEVSRWLLGGPILVVVRHAAQSTSRGSRHGRVHSHGFSSNAPPNAARGLKSAFFGTSADAPLSSAQEARWL